MAVRVMWIVAEIAIEWTCRQRESKIRGRLVPLAQLDRASASGAEGYRFDSCGERESNLHSQNAITAVPGVGAKELLK